MMKHILLTLLLTFTLNTAYGEGEELKTYELTNEKRDIGKLVQGYQSVSKAKFYLKRTKKNPKKVKMKFNFDEYYSYCSDTEVQEVWIEGTYIEDCYYDKEGKCICDKEWVPGHYDYQKVCVAWDYASHPEYESFKLDFKKAKRLRSDDHELFLVEMT